MRYPDELGLFVLRQTTVTIWDSQGLLVNFIAMWMNVVITWMYHRPISHSWTYVWSKLIVMSPPNSFSCCWQIKHFLKVRTISQFTQQLNLPSSQNLAVWTKSLITFCKAFIEQYNCRFGLHLRLTIISQMCFIIGLLYWKRSELCPQISALFTLVKLVDRKTGFMSFS